MSDQPTVHSGEVSSGRVCAQPAEQACLSHSQTHGNRMVQIFFSHQYKCCHKAVKLLTPTPCYVEVERVVSYIMTAPCF